jgi:hypothetical protein
VPYTYHDKQRGLQEQFDTTRVADRLIRIVHDRLTEDDAEFIEAMDMFFLATVDADGHPNCSYKGGEPGFVRVVDETTIAFPNYDGNGMYMSMGNVAATGEVGMLFIDFEEQHRMRLNGTASIDPHDPLMAEYPEAQFIVRVKTREIFANCPRYIHKMELVERSRFVPKAGCETPVPAWKVGLRNGTGAETLPADDRARSDEAEVLDR